MVLVTDGRMIVKASGDIYAGATRRLENARDEALHAGAHGIDIDVEGMASCCSSALRVGLFIEAADADMHMTS
ncbi:hypothetical protein AB0C89_21190 [Streptomyces sp. NPDC048491]|uniref:hypothetical protein n=1 Tax=Streptomyces sp. NPDC048491 TaxID=3157207 RepID=UPI003444F0C9